MYQPHTSEPKNGKIIETKSRKMASREEKIRWWNKIPLEYEWQILGKYFNEKREELTDEEICFAYDSEHPEEPKEGILGEKLFTEKEMRDCFKESRLTHACIGFKHDTFEDYMKSVEQPQSAESIWWNRLAPMQQNDYVKQYMCTHPPSQSVLKHIYERESDESFHAPTMGEFPASKVSPQPPEESAEVEKLKERVEETKSWSKDFRVSSEVQIIFENQLAMMSWMIANSNNKK